LSLEGAARGVAGQATAAEDITAGRHGINDLSALANILGSQGSKTVPPRERSSGVSYIGSPELLLIGAWGSAAATPSLGSSAFLAVRGGFIESAAPGPLPTAPPHGQVKSAPKATSRTTGSQDAVRIPIRPLTFRMLLGNVAVIALLGFAWRRVGA